MSLNDKYIINGSTLSDIGNALRSSGILNPSTVIESAKVLSYSLSFSDGYYSQFSTTVTANSFAFSGKTPTAAKVFFQTTSGSNSMTCNNINLTKSWSTAATYSFPLNLKGSGPWNTAYGTITIVPLVNKEYIAQDSSIILPSQSYSWNTYEGAGKTVPNLIQVSDIATLLAADKEYQFYTLSSSITGDNIHNQTSNSQYSGMNMPYGLDYTKMIYCSLDYDYDYYNFMYIRDLMPYIANEDKTKIFFPCVYNYHRTNILNLTNIINTRTLRNNQNPYVANSWYGIGYSTTWGDALINGGVQITGITENNVTIKYVGGLGNPRSDSNRVVAIFEK